MKICNCALPEILGSSECCNNCSNQCDNIKTDMHYAKYKLESIPVKWQWHDVRTELPENNNKVLGAWKYKCADTYLWDYAIVKYNKFNQNEWMKDLEVVNVEFWKEIDAPF